MSHWWPIGHICLSLGTNVTQPVYKCNSITEHQMAGHCGAVSENGLPRYLWHIHFRAWSPVGGTIWKRLGGVALPAEVLSPGVGFEVSKARPHHFFPVISLSLWWLSQEVRPQLLLQHHGCLLPCSNRDGHGLSPSETVSPQ